MTFLHRVKASTCPTHTPLKNLDSRLLAVGAVRLPARAEWLRKRRTVREREGARLFLPMDDDDLAGDDAAPSSSSSSSSSTADSAENAKSEAAALGGCNDDGDDGIRIVSIITPAREPEKPEEPEEQEEPERRPTPPEAPARHPGTRHGAGEPPAAAGSGGSDHLAPLGAWVASALHLRRTQGLRFTENLRHNVKFQNPAVCSKMIAFCGLDEHGTNVKPGDRRASPVLEDPSAYYDVLAERQRTIVEERAVKRQTY
jgi:HCNGP-like protein